MDKRRTYKILGMGMLVAATMIWGCAFVAQKDAMKDIGPLTMNGMRSVVAALFLYPFALLVDRLRKKKFTLLGAADKKGKRDMLFGGLYCGLLLTAASTAQQYGIKYTSVGKSGFLTTLYIAMVPLFGLFVKKRVNWNGWVAAFLALSGTFLMCYNPSEKGINAGDLMVIVSAVFFAVHILFIDKYTKITDGIRLSCFQFAVCGTLCLIAAFIFERPSASGIINAWFPIFFVGVMSSGVGYTLQVLAQKWVEPHITPLFMSLESLFCLLAGAIFLGEKFNMREYAGSFVLFTAIILAQITFKRRRKNITAAGEKNRGFPEEKQ